MVQLKYFGDNRDYFKYDLITSIFVDGLLDRYVFIPMLTKHRFDNEGKKRPIFNGDKSHKLFEFINTCKDKSLKHWKTWLTPYVSSYQTAESVDAVFFSDTSRSKYWGKYTHLMKSGNTLVFVDPDTGLQTGSESYRRKQGPEKYILNTELKDLFENLHHQSILMIYQHLPLDKNKHQAAVDGKVKQARLICGSDYICAYREDDLAFIFIAKSKENFHKLKRFLHNYCKNSDHRNKGIACLPIRPRS